MIQQIFAFATLSLITKGSACGLISPSVVLVTEGHGGYLH